MAESLKKLKELFDLKDADLRTYSPLTLAYIGDGVYELVIRTILVKKANCPVNRLHKKASSLVKASAQSGMMEILEPLLTEEEKVRMARLVTENGADFIKTSTGFSTGGATFADVKLLRESIGAQVKVKAAGGISSLADAEQFMALGADRLGTSKIIKIVKDEKIDTNEY